jgi:hypothetical protein
MILILLFIIFLFTTYCLKCNYNRKEKFTSKNKPKKIAFCFLIYKEIYHEDLWNEYLKNIDPNKYSIYIHYKENQPLKHFEKHKLNHTIETCWGCLSVVQAQNLILKEALKDKNNQHFVWLSDSCIPIKSFNYIYNYLDTKKSYYNICPDEQVFPRANNVLKYVDRQNIKKANMASVINRKHALLFADSDHQIDTWFKDINNVDEIVYITLLFHNNLQDELVLTPNVAAGSIIFAQWADMKNYKVFNNSKKKNDYTYEYICPEELKYLITSKSLFARKFVKNCKGLENLLELIKN